MELMMKLRLSGFAGSTEAIGELRLPRQDAPRASGKGMALRCGQSANRSAFTLIEVMISLALALILMIGINYVFRAVTDASGAGQAISDGISGARSAQASWVRDFNATVTTEAPFLIIGSRPQYAFRNTADLTNDRDGNPATADLLNTGGAETNVQASTYGQRCFRADVMSMFVRDLIKRQTGGDTGVGAVNPFVANQTSDEAMVWYGHLWLPDNSGTASTAWSNATMPGAGNRNTNPNNYFASQWTLGRVAVLLTPRDSSGLILDRSTPGKSQIYFPTPTPEPAANAADQSPLLFPLRIDSATGGFSIGDSRYDLADTSISAYRDRLSKYIARKNGPWYNYMFNGDTGTAVGIPARFKGMPYFVKPIGPKTYAQQAPIFLPNCSQFMVEYAGDFLKQDNDPTSSTYGETQGVGCVSYTDSSGNMQGLQNPSGTDGQIDYVLFRDSSNNLTKQIRWYGLPRDTASYSSTSGGISAVGADNVINGYASGVTSARRLVDVVPLKDLIAQFVSNPANVSTIPLPTGASVLPYASFEKSMPTPGADYRSSMTIGDLYICAWGPDDVIKPKLIRITIVLDDPTGRLKDGQTFEYVFKIQD